VLSVVLIRAGLASTNRNARRSRFTLEPVKARCVINEQLSLALLADIVSLQEDIDRADFQARSSGSTQLTMNGI
jgi:hypothetical protein